MALLHDSGCAIRRKMMITVVASSIGIMVEIARAMAIR
jgi:hypothetical protein